MEGPVPIGATLFVTGARSDEVNGYYKEVRVRNGSPVFERIYHNNQLDNNFQIYQLNNEWGIWTYDWRGDGHLIYTHTDVASRNPPTNDWHANKPGTEGRLPCPTITYL